MGLLPLERATAQVAPAPGNPTYVQIENWMWVPETQWHDLSKTVSVGPVSVTATASPQRVQWDMGDESAECSDAGRAWRKGMSDAAKSNCTFAYNSLEDPEGDSHDVSAQIVYAVSWTCSGACDGQGGDLGEVVAPSGETTTIEVRQRQTVVTE